MRRAAAALVAVGSVSLALGAFAGASPARTSESPTPRQPPTITGIYQEGQTLTANNGQWLYSNGLGCGSECVYTYQWQRTNPQGFNAINIPGATNRQYTLTAADVGNRVLVVNTLTKYDCNARGQDCRYVSTSQNSALGPIVSPKPGVAPSVASGPAITGTAMEDETLTASTGTWNGEQPISLAFAWLRCAADGSGCSPIGGATAQTYALTAADVGATIRVTGTATNKWGSASSTSAQTPVVAALAPRPGKTTLPVEKVSVPHRLIVDQFVVRPGQIRSLAPFTARFRVSDERGFRIVGALVRVQGVPFGQLLPVPAAPTDATGWATFTLTPTARLKLERGNAVYLYVRAWKRGDSTVAGVSNTALFRVKVVPPATARG